MTLLKLSDYLKEGQGGLREMHLHTRPHQLLLQVRRLISYIDNWFRHVHCLNQGPSA